MRLNTKLWLLSIVVITSSGVSKMGKVEPKIRKAIMDTLKVDGSEIGVITMDGGDKIYIKFYPEDAPNTVKNFIMLANLSFYDSLTFHRVVPNFVVQGGDPVGNGTGDPGYSIAAEFNNRNHLLGTVAMARSQAPNSAGCQFYICLTPQPHLDKQYTVFGQVIKGMDVVHRIKQGDIMQSIKIEHKSYEKLCLLCKGMPESAIYTPPTAVSITLPDYPDDLLTHGAEGTIYLRIQITDKGEVGVVKIMEDSKIPSVTITGTPSRSIEYNEGAIKSIVKTWVFNPAKVAGTPILDWINVVLKFEITGRDQGVVSCLGQAKEVKKLRRLRR